MAWDTQWSPSFVNMFKATGTQFSATIFLPCTGLLRNCISTKYSVVGLCDQAKKSSLHASMTKQRSRMKVSVLALTWMDKKAVHATGTYTKAPAQQLPKVNCKQRDCTIEKIPCPKLVSCYNTYMGGVDKNDKMKSYYPIPVAGKKLWSRVFYDLIDRSI